MRPGEFKFSKKKKFDAPYCTVYSVHKQFASVYTCKQIHQTRNTTAHTHFPTSNVLFSIYLWELQDPAGLPAPSSSPPCTVQRNTVYFKGTVSCHFFAKLYNMGPVWHANDKQ